MLMPQVGRNALNAPFAGAGFVGLPERYEPALRSGVRFFEIMYPRHVEYSQPLMGVYDVKVDEIPTGRTSTFRENWMTGHNAGVQFLVIDDKKRIAVAHVPDDRYYHNRVVIADSPELYANITQLVTADQGIIPASQVKMEIACLIEVLNEQAPIYSIMSPDGRKELDCFWDKDEAERFIKSSVTTFEGPNLVPVERHPYLKCHIVEGVKMRKKPEIAAMIKRYQHEHYGWTSTTEFREKVQSKVESMISERRKSELLKEPQAASAVDVRSQILDVIASLSPEQLESLREAARQRYAQPPAVKPKYTRADLQRMKLEEVQEIAAANRIPFEGVRKADLVDLILGETVGEVAEKEVIR